MSSKTYYRNRRSQATVASIIPAPRTQFITLQWTPVDGPQRQAYETKADELFYGGSAGGGKSELLLGLTLTAHKKSIIFRREYPQLQEIVLRSHELIRLAGKFNGQKNIWRDLPGDRILEFGAVKMERDWLKYQGRPHDFLGFDEITHFSKSQYQNLSGWARTTVPGQRVRIVATGNPPSTAEGEWVLDHWAPWLKKDHPNPAAPGELRWFAMLDGKEIEVSDPTPFTHKGESITPKSRTFIPARLTDNPYLSQSDYASVLQRLPEPLRTQLLYGDFSIKVDSDAWSIIPRDFLLKGRAQYDSNPRYWDMLALNYGWVLGVDVGDRVDRHSIALWRGPVLYQVNLIDVVGDDEDTSRLVDEIEKTVRRLGDARIAIDRIGVGAHVFSDLKRKGYKVYPCVFGSSAQDKTQFGNRKAELYWKFRDGLRLGTFAIAPFESEEIVFEELRAIRYNTNTEKQIVCESKEQTKSRLKRSPDGADGTVTGLEVEMQTIDATFVVVGESEEERLTFPGDSISEVNKWFKD